MLPGGSIIVRTSVGEAVLLLIIIGVCHFVQIVDHKILGDKNSKAADQGAEDHPEENAGSGFIDRHTVAVLSSAINAVCLFVVPVETIDSTGDDGKNQYQDIVRAVLAVAIKYRVDILHIHIPEIDSINPAGNKIQDQKVNKISVIFYVRLKIPLFRYSTMTPC